MNNQQFFPSSLLRLSPRLSIASDPQGWNLQNINTTTLADGAVCWVRDEAVDFRFLRDSTSTADGVNIVAPAAGGPGRWFRGASGFASDFAYAKNSAQAGITTNVNLTMDNNGLMRGITRPGGSQTVWQLTPGKIYLLSAGGYFDSFSDAAAGFIRLDWVDGNNTRLNSGSVDACSGQFYPTTNTNPQSSGDMPPLIYQAGAGALAQVKLRCTNATGTAALSSAQFAASLVEIS